ncbi:MAG: class II aldolase/adducin family protein [Bacillota bacterium]
MSDVIREQIVKISKLMYDKGMANAYAGNVSVREGDSIYITPSGISKGFLAEDMIVQTDMNGYVIEGMYKPSSEIKLHLAAYRKRSDVRSVIHAHPVYATAYAVANKPIETMAYAEMIMFFDKIPLAKYGTPSSDEIYQGMEEYIDEYDIILLANHGVVTVGEDVFDAFFKLEAAEGIAKTLTIAHMIGGEKSLPEEKLKELDEIRRRYKNKL